MAFARLLFRFLLILLILLVVIGLALPAKVTVEREVLIAATPEKIFSQIDNLKNFHAWSPWSGGSPGTRYSFDGPESGVGARMTWSNEQAEGDHGSMEITRSVALQTVEMQLNFGGKGQGIATFELQPQHVKNTRVKWRFQTDFGWDLFGRYIGLMFDSMIGASYERGLQTLKQRAEAT